LIAPLVALGTAMVFDLAFSAEARPHSPRGLGPVSIYSMSFSIRKEKIKVLFSRTTTSISLRRRTFLMLELNEISVRFFLS
jgi:hypothetical protein